jgi:hypothetical protein
MKYWKKSCSETKQKIHISVGRIRLLILNKKFGMEKILKSLLFMENQKEETFGKKGKIYI